MACLPGEIENISGGVGVWLAGKFFTKPPGIAGFDEAIPHSDFVADDTFALPWQPKVFKGSVPKVV